MPDEFLTLKEISLILKVSMAQIYRTWHSWSDYGVRILRLTPNAEPRFYKSDILKMLEAHK